MSIFSKTVSDLQTADLGELLADGAVENVRLEFKQDYPDKDEILKKLSSFANTYGGYLVIGGEATSRDGRLKVLGGVVPTTGYRQRIVQWCYEAVAPPLTVFVSDPIPSPQDTARSCYVILVPESEEAPHFLEGRKGCYVRTDEFSQRFEPRLATYEDIEHLANRRNVAVERRRKLIEHAERRFTLFVNEDGRALSGTRQPGPAGVLLTLAICPHFPTRLLRPHGDLLGLVVNQQIPWRQTGFPAPTNLVTQHESVLALDAAGGLSSMEASVWGLIFYGVDVERASEQGSGIHLHALVGCLLAFLEHSGRMYQALGFDGSLISRVSLRGVLGKPIMWTSRSIPFRQHASPLDDQVTFEHVLLTSRLRDQRDAVAAEVLRTIFFALNWAAAADDEGLKRAVNAGYEFNLWTIRRP